MRYLVAFLCALFLSHPLAAQTKTATMDTTHVLFQDPRDSSFQLLRVLQFRTNSFDHLLESSLVTEFFPNRIYSELWDKTMACSGLTISAERINKIRWYWVEGHGFTLNSASATDANIFAGYSFIYHDKIWVVEGGIGNSRLIQHEMLHIIMYVNKKRPGHNNAYYVSCNL